MRLFPSEFSIGMVRVAPATVLAPMAGVTDTVFRRFIRNLGGCGLLMTEFTSSHGVKAAEGAHKPTRTLKQPRLRSGRAAHFGAVVRRRPTGNGGRGACVPAPGFRHRVVRGSLGVIVEDGDIGGVGAEDFMDDTAVHDEKDVGPGLFGIENGGAKAVTLAGFVFLLALPALMVAQGKPGGMEELG